MKYILTSNQPQSLIEWKKNESIEGQRHYDGSLPSDVKEDIRNHRVEDQGGLCAYTMREIVPLHDGTWDAHIEHVVARSYSKASGNLEETVDYKNMVVCVNKAANLPYGASARGDRELPVTPFDQSCERRFSFSLEGKMKSANSSDAEAESTIEILRLNHDQLRDLRLAAMAREGFALHVSDNNSGNRFRPPKSLSSKAARLLAETIVKPKPDGRLPAFCVAIAYAAWEHAKRVEKIAKQAELKRRAATN